MNPTEILRAIFLPLTQLTVLLAIALFAVFATIGMNGGVLGIFVLILLLPPVFRFQMIVLEACARGEEPDPLDAEYFSWIGNAWSLFPLPLVVFITWAAIAAGIRFGEGAGLAVLLLAAALLPASLIVLVVTRSPLQSLNPLAILGVLRTAGVSFLIASAYLFLTSWLCLNLGPLPLVLANFIQLFLTFSFFSLTGTLVAPHRLFEDVYISDAVEPDEDELRAEAEKMRESAVNHAYGFVSRGNREGGFRHVMGEIAKDGDPAGAWAWYFNRMLGWENQQHALFFAQHYVRDALRHGEDVAALKVIMRCRLVDPGFKPFPEDRQAAIKAAETHRNIELADVLKRG